MATLELTTLSDHLEEDEIGALAKTLRDFADQELNLSAEGDSVIIERDIDDDLFTDFIDRLDANEAAADIYVPIEFDEVVRIGERRFASSHALLLVLENLKEDFFIDDEEESESESDDDEDDFDDEEHEFESEEESHLEAKDEQLRHIWRALYRAAQMSAHKELCLFVHE